MSVCLKTSALISFQCKFIIEKNKPKKNKKNMEKVAIIRCGTKRKEQQQQQSSKKTLAEWTNFSFVLLMHSHLKVEMKTLKRLSYTPEAMIRQRIMWLNLLTNGNVEIVKMWKCGNCKKWEMGNGQMKVEGSLATKWGHTNRSTGRVPGLMK